MTDARWLDHVPEDWSVDPAWSVFIERGEKSSPGDVHLTPSQVFGVLAQDEYMARTGNRVVLNLAGQDNMKSVRTGDLIIHLRSFQGGIEYSSVDGKVSSAYTVLKPTRPMCAGYFAYLMKSKGFIGELANLTFQLRDGQTVNYPRFSRMYLPVPPLLEQRAIADFLDREVGEIDAMVAKMDELTAVLSARRLLTIASVLGSDDVCRPTPMFALASSEDHRRVPLKAEDRAKIPGPYPYFGASGVIDSIDSFIWDDEVRVLVSEDGANLVARRHPIAFLARGQYWVNNHAHVLRPDQNVDGRLISYAIAITNIQDAITGSAQPKLTAEALWRLKVPFPRNLSDSAKIADHLDEVTGRIDAMLAKVAELKTLLIERRAALITDVVTGRKKVA